MMGRSRIGGLYARTEKVFYATEDKGRMIDRIYVDT